MQPSSTCVVRKGSKKRGPLGKAKTCAARHVVYLKGHTTDVAERADRKA